MASQHHFLINAFLLLFLLVRCSLSLKFDLFSHPGPNPKNERCIRNFVNSDTLVVVTATIDGYKGDGQVVNMHVCLFYLSVSVGIGRAQAQLGLKERYRGVC